MHPQQQQQQKNLGGHSPKSRHTHLEIVKINKERRNLLFFFFRVFYGHKT